MGSLKDFNETTTKISHGGVHNFDEALQRTPPGFILTSLNRSLDYHHWTVEYIRIEEWKKEGGEYNVISIPEQIEDESHLLYILAVVIIIIWAIGFLAYDPGPSIHILLVISVLAVILRMNHITKS